MATLKSLINSKYYPFVLALVALAIWLTKIEQIGIVLFAVLAIAAFLVNDDMTSGFIPLLMLTFSIGDEVVVTDYLGANLIWLIPLAVALVGSIVWFFVKQRMRIKLGKMFWPFLAMAVTYMLGGVFTHPENVSNSITMTVIFALGSVFVYLVVYNGMRGEREELFVCTFIAIGMLVCVELLIFYLGVEFDDVIYKKIYFGWGVSNNIASILLLTMAFSGYLTATGRYWYIHLIMLFLQYVCILLTLSRGCILFASIGLPAMLVLAFIKTQNKKIFAIICGVAIATICILCLSQYSILKGIIMKLIDKGFSDSGRFGLYKEAWQDFLSAPILGMGAGHRYEEGNMLYMYHCTPLQFLANAGIVGLAAYAYYCVRKYLMLLTAVRSDKISSVVLYAMIGMLMWEGYSIIDVNFFIISQMIIMVIMLAFIEKKVYNKLNSTKYNLGDEPTKTNKIGAKDGNNV